MPSGEDFFRLVWVVLLNGALAGCAYRCAARFAGPLTRRLTDTFLLFYLVQYISVGLPGLCGLLSPLSMTLTALACCILLVAGSLAWPCTAEPLTGLDSSQNLALLAAGLFAIAYLAGLVYTLRFGTVVATDALAYHIPTAVHWLRTGRLALFPTWFFNPANTWSPLAGSTFIAWLMAPAQNDVLARFVQVPPLLCLFCTSVELCRSLGAGAAVGGLVGVATVVFWPLLSEATLGKDDLFVTAFFMAAVAGSAPQKLREPTSPWRVGIALGLCLATKYTALSVLPIYLLMIDGPARAWSGRQKAVAVAAILLLAGPWYIRNLSFTGNPVFPVDVSFGGHTLLHGLFRVRPSHDLRSWAGIRAVFVGRYYSVPPVMLIVLAAGWIAAVGACARTMLADSLVRICLLGPPLGFTLFVWLSPYPEVRFVFPSLVLLFGAFALATSSWLGPRPCVQIAAAVALAIISLYCGFHAHQAITLLAGAGLAASAGGVGLVLIQERFLHWTWRGWAAVASLAAFFCAIAAYVYWPAYVFQCHEASAYVWPELYPRQAPAWKFVREHVPPDAAVAYANTSLVYPLMNFRRVILYVPTRRGLDSFSQLPHSPSPVTGEEMVPTVTAILTSQPDDREWSDRLRKSGARYLTVVKHDAGDNPPELALAARHPARFQVVFEDEGAIIYQILR